MAIEIKKYSPTSHKLKALIYGAPKTGKTTFAGTAPRPLFICAENGLLSIAKQKPDFVEVKTLQELKDLSKWLRDTKPDYDTIVIDSLSEISKIIKDNLTNNGNKQMVLRDRGVFSEEMMQAVRQIVNLPYHVICIVHSKEVLNDSGSVEFYDLAIEGKAKNEIPRYFDVIGYSSIDSNGVYHIHIQGNSKTVCGDRSNTIPKENTPNSVTEWIQAISTISTDAPQVVTAVIESVPGFNKLDSLTDQYDKIDLVMGTEDNIEMAKGLLRVKISWAKNLSDSDKINLLDYINSK